MLEINGEKSARVVPKTLAASIGEISGYPPPAFSKFVFTEIGFNFCEQVQHMSGVEIENALGARFARRRIAIRETVGPIGIRPALRPGEQAIVACA